MSKEYLKVRPYLYKDIYPLTTPGAKSDVWSAVQYHDAESDSGVLQVFRREKSPYRTADFTLGGLTEGKEYVFEDADTGEKFTLTGRELSIVIENKRQAKLWFYKTK